MANYLDFAHRNHIVPIGQYEDYNADVDLKSFNMKNFHKACILLMFHDMGTEVCTVKVYSGATAGAKASQLTFSYAYMGAAEGAANSDVLGTEGSATVLNVDEDVYDGFTLVIEVDGSAMDVANGEEWLTVELTDSAGSATGHASGYAILEPRYQGVNLTALT